MKKKRLVIADDDRELVRALAARCRSSGLRVNTATDGLEAGIELFLNGDNGSPDLIILDINMPGDDGFSICEELFRDERLSLIPVIILTARSDKATIRRCEELGAHYVFKTKNLWDKLEPILVERLKIKPVSTIAAARSAARVDRAARKFAPRVLWIDDDRDFLSAMRSRLKGRGVEVIPAYTGLQGYLRALKEKPDAIITDYVMREGYGSYVVRRLKQHGMTAGIPVVVVTGHDLLYRPTDKKDPSMERQFHRLGAECVLIKPVNIDELLERLRKHVDLPLEAASRSADEARAKQHSGSRSLRSQNRR